MNDQRVDLSALDPARDAERWERRIQAVMARVVQARRWTLAGQLASWARPALVLAAAAALCSWLGLVLSPRSLSGEASSAEVDAHALLSRWANSAEQPSAASLLSVLGERP